VPVLNHAFRTLALERIIADIDPVCGIFMDRLPPVIFSALRQVTIRNAPGCY
jgi:hypothetical protein